MGGPFWARKEVGAWTIPKGEVHPGEDPQAAALRECKEEFGFAPAGMLIPLTPIVQKNGKRVHAWAVECDRDPITIKSNMFGLEWPPKSGRTVQFPEIDRAAWFTIPIAERLAIRGQAALFGELSRLIGQKKGPGADKGLTR